MTSHFVTAVLQLPDNAFTRTEARTHVLFLRKGGGTRGNILLYRPDEFAGLGTPLAVAPEQMLERMDFSYHLWRTGVGERSGATTLGDSGAHIKRGIQTKRIPSEQRIPFVHTTDLPREPAGLALQTESVVDAEYRAEPEISCLGGLVRGVQGELPMSAPEQR